MSKSVKTINQKITELQAKIDWFQSDKFNIDLAVEEYKSAAVLAKEIESDLETIKNKITTINKDFSA